MRFALGEAAQWKNKINCLHFLNDTVVSQTRILGNARTGMLPRIEYKTHSTCNRAISCIVSRHTWNLIEHYFLPANRGTDFFK